MRSGSKSFYVLVAEGHKDLSMNEMFKIGMTNGTIGPSGHFKRLAGLLSCDEMFQKRIKLTKKTIDGLKSDDDFYSIMPKYAVLFVDENIIILSIDQLISTPSSHPDCNN